MYLKKWVRCYVYMGDCLNYTKDKKSAPDT